MAACLVPLAEGHGALADSKMLITACDDMHCHLYDAASGSLIEAFSGQHLPLCCPVPILSHVLLSSGRRILVAIFAQRENAEPVKVCALAAGHESWVLSVSCHPSGTAIATGSSDSRVKLWDLRARTCAQTVADHSDQVTPACLLSPLREDIAADVLCTCICPRATESRAAFTCWTS